MATVRCVFAAELNLRGGHSCGAHTHACTELVYYVDGHGHLTQDDQTFRYTPGCVSVYQPRQHHADHPSTDGRQLCVGVNGCGAEALPAGMWHPDDSLTDGFLRFRREIAEPVGHATQDRLDILAGWLVLELQRLTANHERTARIPAPVKAARDVLDARFDETIDFQQLAGSLFISPDYLRHIFKQCLGESPLNYLIRRRLDAACELLAATDLPIQEIAQRVGLENPYYFSRIFRKKLGQSPSQYRQHARRRG